ncbi:CLUMA_CG012689, isoform A [Clunio marinus]|uniref:Mannosyltransferase n=1 Tax=Clunio marinus TaxID=568069 RepID=A0A1J1ILD4_9DIPT|nr:CLUMA_CG012689, isoform A [Clunio marinus]
MKKVLFFLIIVRIFSVYLVQTFFSPDEYWQSLEVAHKIIYGYGHLTWEWSQGIRSYLHPVIISILYKILAVLKFDSVDFLVYLPRIFQALLSAYADYRFYNWCNKKKWSLFIVATSWFWFYTGGRTIINSFEASLTTIALSYFPWRSKDENTRFLWIVMFLTYIRPTSALTWAPICIYHLKKSQFSLKDLIIKRYILIGLILSTFLVAIDTFFHGSFVITPLRFFKFNVLNSVGSFYGQHPFHWYLSSGLPAVLGINIIPFSFAALNILKNFNENSVDKVLLSSIGVTLLGYSLLSHKEFRFLLQILPLCLFITANYLSKWSRTKSKFYIWIVATVIFVANVIPAGYLGFVHQQGPLKVVNRLAKIAEKYELEQGKPPYFFFMMPCHSTPYYSHIHVNVTMRFLTCEPPLQNDNKKYIDESEKFYEAPMKWIRTHLPVHPITALPTHIVLYDTLLPKVNDFLSIYKPIDLFFNSDHLVSSRSGRNILLYERVHHEDKTGYLESMP